MCIYRAMQHLEKAATIRNVSKLCIEIRLRIVYHLNRLDNSQSLTTHAELP